MLIHTEKGHLLYSILPIQILLFSRNTFADSHRINFQPSIWASWGPGKLTHKINCNKQPQKKKKYVVLNVRELAPFTESQVNRSEGWFLSSFVFNPFLTVISFHRHLFDIDKKRSVYIISEVFSFQII